MQRRSRHAKTAGFSLLEMMVAVAILVTVFAIVLEGIANLQRRSSAENAKVDAVQQTREFMDQISRDLHQLGYPPFRAEPGGNASCTSSTTQMSCGWMYPSTGTASLPNGYQMQFEGDLDGNGTVDQETVRLVDSSGAQVTSTTATCPCTIQRGTVPKATGGTPTFYTEVNNVMNANPVFTYYTATPGSNGACTPIGSGTPTSSQCLTTQIRSVHMSVTVLSPSADLQSKVQPSVGITSDATLFNIQ